MIVNDIGASRAGEGADVHPAEQTVQDIISAGGEAALNTDDVSSWAGAEALVNQAVNSWGKLDILVNNAGILRDKMSFNMDESDWDDTIRVHLKGHFALSHFAAIHWRNRAKAGEEVSGRIINTASEAGLFGNAGQANYGAAKAGIAAMTIIFGPRTGALRGDGERDLPRARTRMTEDLFGEMAKAEEGKFDTRSRRRTSPRWSCSWPRTRRPISPGRTSSSSVARSGSCRDGGPPATSSATHAGPPRNWPTTSRRSSPAASGLPPFSFF